MKTVLLAMALTQMVVAPIAWCLMNQPHLIVERDGEGVCAASCGEAYVCQDNATEEDFNKLLKASKKACKQEEGKEVSYRNHKGELKHAVVIGNAKVIKKPGTRFDACVINWEVTRETALKAFKEVCVQRKF